MRDYKTILEYTETEIEIKKSKFIGRVYHVETEDAIESILNDVRKEHYKATHVCPAYVLGETDDTPRRQKANDDGEPAGTAGKPMLEIINNHELENVLVIVIRYFGGIKLGAGGLVRAYAGTTAQVIQEAPVILKQLSDLITIEIDYNQYGNLINKLTAKGYTPVSENFGEKVSLDFYLPVAETENFIARLTDLTNDQFEYVVMGREYVDVRC